MAVVLLSYAAGDRVHFANQRALTASARRFGGFDRIEARGPLPANHPLRSAHPEIFDVTGGAGCWLWKPQIVLEALQRSAADDIVVYADAGLRLRHSLARLVALAQRSDAVLFRNDYANAAYTKRDAFVLTGTDTPAAHASLQLDAALMLWRNTPAAQRLAAAWLEACRDSRALLSTPAACGLPELPAFREHRHDQALLSLVVWRDRARAKIALLPRRLKYHFAQHHRRRNRGVPIPAWHAVHDGAWEIRRRCSRERTPPPLPPCRMRRLPEAALYREVDACLAFLRALPAPSAVPHRPLPVHFYWDGADFGPLPALCLRSFLATQDARRVRPWLWLAQENVRARAASNPLLAPLLSRLELPSCDLAELAAGTPFADARVRAGFGSAAARSDIFRLLCCHRHGGCYSDLDAIFLRDLAPLLALAGDAEFCFQWSHLPAGTNAFSCHRAGSGILQTLLDRARALGTAHPRRLLAFDHAPPQLLLLPVAAFSPLWLIADGKSRSAFAGCNQFDDFFSPLDSADPRRATLETFFPGAFTYHWHGRWNSPWHPHSWAGHLAAEIGDRLQL